MRRMEVRQFAIGLGSVALDYLEAGHSLDEFLDDFPSVTSDLSGRHGHEISARSLLTAERHIRSGTRQLERSGVKTDKTVNSRSPEVLHATVRTHDVRLCDPWP
jgi:hypothetical protein